jgi:hypothetical protein
MQVTLAGEAGRKYALYASSNLLDWDIIATLTNQIGSVAYTDIQTANLVVRFYKAVQIP